MDKNKIMDKYIPEGFKAAIDGNVGKFAVPAGDILNVCRKLYFEHRLQLKTITAADERSSSGKFRIYYVFGAPMENIFIVQYQ